MAPSPIGDRLRIGPAVLEVLQEAAGALPMDDLDQYTPTSPEIPVVPRTTKYRRPTEPNE